MKKRTDEFGRSFPDFCKNYEEWLLIKEKLDRAYNEAHPPISAMSDNDLAALAKALHIKHGPIEY